MLNKPVPRICRFTFKNSHNHFFHDLKWNNWLPLLFYISAYLEQGGKHNCLAACVYHYCFNHKNSEQINWLIRWLCKMWCVTCANTYLTRPSNCTNLSVLSFTGGNSGIRANHPMSSTEPRRVDLMRSTSLTHEWYSFEKHLSEKISKTIAEYANNWHRCIVYMTPC